MANLHYLDLSDYGRLAAPEDLQDFIDNDARMSRGYVMTEDNLYSFLRIDDFTIDVFSDVQIHGSTGHRKSLHAEFGIAQGGLRIATWFRPVVKRLFWIGYPLHCTTHLTSNMDERMLELSVNALDGLPKSILLPPR